MRYITHILKLLFVTCVCKVEGNAFLKRRLGTLEMRVNVIDQHIEELNTSFITLEDKMCQNVKDEHNGELKQTSSQFDGVSQSTETLIRKGLFDEKKWLRKKMSIIENNMREVENQVESNSGTVEEMVARMHVMVNDFDRKLDSAISEVMANCSAEIRKWDEKMNEHLKQIVNKTEVDNLEQIVNNTETDNLKQTEDEIKEGSSCPDGWDTFHSFCYLYDKESKTYVSARETCLKLGASVADIQSSSENDFVYKLCENNGHIWRYGNVWIGVTDEETEGVWIADRTGEKSAYMNWRPGQPDHHDAGQDCLMMGYDTPIEQWNDWPCDDSYHKAQFVCKKVV